MEDIQTFDNSYEDKKVSSPGSVSSKTIFSLSSKFILAQVC